ncbi:MAG: murein biosynthesis integral membrane protein MurJ, partial [Anaerolineae bacterium]|nr:murein biosynthesis integral membrane protein MurJ [Anaerolineae bacterium]
FNLVAGGALASAFVPTLTELLAHEKRERAWKLASAVANLVLLILTSAALLAAIFAPQVVKYALVPGWSATDPAKEALTVDLLRIQLPSAVIFGLSGLVMGILNAHQHFLFPALTPAMYQIGWIFGAVVLTPHMGVYGMAWGVVLGSAMHLLLQVPSLVRLPFARYSLSLGRSIPEVGEVVRLMGPRLVGVAVVQLNFLLNTYLASFQPLGSLPGITYAFQLMYMPEAAIAQSIAIATLPTFSAQVARGKLEDMRASLATALRGMLMLAIPASVGLVLLREPIVVLLFQRRQFTAESTEMVAWALLWYGAGLVFHSLLEIASRAFYALKDTKTPVMVGVGAMTLNLVFSIAFSALFVQLGWMPHGGLALANSLATALEVCVLLYLMRRKLKGLQAQIIWDLVWKAALAATVMGLALQGWLMLVGNFSVWLVVGGGLVLGGALYLLMMALLKTPEIKMGWNVTMKIFRRFIP